MKKVSEPARVGWGDSDSALGVELRSRPHSSATRSVHRQLTPEVTHPHSNQQGQKGIVANYLTRSQVLRRLQISLRDFRCVEVRVFVTMIGAAPRHHTPSGPDDSPRLPDHIKPHHHHRVYPGGSASSRASTRGTPRRRRRGRTRPTITSRTWATSRTSPSSTSSGSSRSVRACMRTVYLLCVLVGGAWGRRRAIRWSCVRVCPPIDRTQLQTPTNPIN